MKVATFSRCNLSSYSISQICVQCLTDLIIFLVALESLIKNLQSPSQYHHLGSLSSRITQLMNCSRHVGYTIFEHLIARGYNLFQNEHVFIFDLSDLTLQIIFNAWWASMNVGSKQHIAWNNSIPAPSWLVYLHCGIEETGSPSIIGIVCHQVLRHPSEHGTSSMGKYLIRKANITKLNELTESKVTELTSSTVDETALAILKMQGSRGITIVSLQRKTIFNIQFNPY
jgi:hypothetical protein